MSLDNCTECFDLVDTDADGDAYSIGDKCLCWRCRMSSPPGLDEWMVGEKDRAPVDESSEGR